MGIFSLGKTAIGHIFNFKVSDWFNTQEHKTNLKYMLDSCLNLFSISTTNINAQESFEQAMLRLNLTEQDLIDRKQEFFRLFFISLIFSISLFIYTIFIAVKYETVYGFILGMSVTFLSFVNVFKYHFWLKQITLRKLGITFREWLN